MSDPRDLALASAHQATEGATEMLRFAREGEGIPGSAFGLDVEPVEKFLDAAKLAIEVRVAVEGEKDLRGDLGQVYGAICKYLEGWV